jgi:hypothetical protein
MTKQDTDYSRLRLKLDQLKLHIDTAWTSAPAITTVLNPPLERSLFERIVRYFGVRQ